jgi:hypothetical protein
MLLNSMRRVRPQDVKQYETVYQAIAQGCRVAIRSSADHLPDAFHRFQGGDYWAKYELTLALGRLGYHVTDTDPDVFIHLFGSPTDPLPGRAYKILWIYSHPERVTPELLGKYDRIFCLSRSFTEQIRRMGFNVEFAPGATSRMPLQQPRQYDIVFVGNTRSQSEKGRWIIHDLGETHYKLTVWGRGWEHHLPPEQIGGTYYDYTRLPELYSTSRIALCDHFPAMREQGFVALRIFDILASGGFCICDSNTGLSEIFENAVPSYSTPKELHDLIEHYMTDDTARRTAMEKGRNIAMQYSWTARARQLTNNIPDCPPHAHG